MRRILVEHGRRRSAKKRGQAVPHEDIDRLAPGRGRPLVRRAWPLAAEADVDFEAIDLALRKLEAIDDGQGRLVELRFFGGLSHRGNRRGHRRVDGNRQAGVGPGARVAAARIGIRRHDARSLATHQAAVRREPWNSRTRSAHDSWGTSCGRRRGIARGSRFAAGRTRPANTRSLDRPAADYIGDATPALDTERWLGRRLGAYEIVALIGVGGMGEVYRARRMDAEYEKEVAIKLVPTGLARRLRAAAPAQ